MSEIIVIGAGVIGLSSALRLQQVGYKVTIIARDFPTPFETADKRALINYSSQWAGAHNRWIIPSGSDPVEDRDHAFSLNTYHHMEETFRRHPEAGVTFMKGIEYLEAPPPAQRDLTEERARELGLQEFRLLGKSDFPDEQVTWGCEYKTWSLNPMVYCSFLLRQFSLLGGQVVSRELGDVHEAFTIKSHPGVRTVVNCSGVGFNDPAVFPTRGTVVGGNREADNWDADPSPELRKRLLQAICTTYPPIAADGPLRPLSDIVGRRPTRRGGIRIESEEVPSGGVEGLAEPGERRIVHAYGLGGRGYELSWGVAEAVLNLVEQ